MAIFILSCFYFLISCDDLKPNWLPAMGRPPFFTFQKSQVMPETCFVFWAFIRSRRNGRQSKRGNMKKGLRHE